MWSKIYYKVESRPTCKDSPGCEAFYLRNMQPWFHESCSLRVSCCEAQRIENPQVNYQAEKSLISSNKSFRCDQCGESFARLDNLLRHSARHKHGKIFDCATCGKGFHRKVRVERYPIFVTQTQNCRTSFLSMKKCTANTRSRVKSVPKRFTPTMLWSIICHYTRYVRFTHASKTRPTLAPGWQESNY